MRCYETSVVLTFQECSYDFLLSLPEYSLHFQQSGVGHPRYNYLLKCSTEIWTVSARPLQLRAEPRTAAAASQPEKVELSAVQLADDHEAHPRSRPRGLSSRHVEREHFTLSFSSSSHPPHRCLHASKLAICNTSHLRRPGKRVWAAMAARSLCRVAGMRRAVIARVLCWQRRLPSSGIAFCPAR